MTTPRGSYKIHIRDDSAENHDLQDLYRQSEFGGNNQTNSSHQLHSNRSSASAPAASKFTTASHASSSQRPMTRPTHLQSLSAPTKTASKLKSNPKEHSSADAKLNQEINAFLDAEDNDPSKLKEKQSSIKTKKQHAKQQRQKSKAKKIILNTILLVLICGGLLLGGLNFFEPTTREEDRDTKDATTTADEIYYSSLTGLPVANKDLVNSAATCVMIENSPEARPQSGLSEAGIVYEAIAEGGITRFMAIFQDQKPAIVGPVRSVRLTFAQFAKPYHCSIAHVGGSGNALSLIRNNNEFRDIDQFFNDSSYWRAKTKPNGQRISAPHNVYTNFEKLDALNFKRGYNNSDFVGFSHVAPDTTPANSALDARNITIHVSSPTWNPTYTYDEVSKTYLRSHAGTGPHLDLKADGSSTQNAPRVVIALKSDAYQRTSERQYQDFKTIGSNDAFIFQNGTVTSAKWLRDNENAELRFIDADGQDIKLERGQVWITIYPSQSGSVTWN